MPSLYGTRPVEDPERGFTSPLAEHGQDGQEQAAPPKSRGRCRLGVGAVVLLTLTVAVAVVAGMLLGMYLTGYPRPYDGEEGHRAQDARDGGHAKADAQSGATPCFTPGTSPGPPAPSRPPAPQPQVAMMLAYLTKPGDGPECPPTSDGYCILHGWHTRHPSAYSRVKLTPDPRGETVLVPHKAVYTLRAQIQFYPAPHEKGTPPPAVQYRARVQGDVDGTQHVILQHSSIHTCPDEYYSDPCYTLTLEARPLLYKGERVSVEVNREVMKDVVYSQGATFIELREDTASV